MASFASHLNYCWVCTKAPWRKICLSPSLTFFVQTSHILLALVKYRQLYTRRLLRKEEKLCFSQWDCCPFKDFLTAATMKQDPVAQICSPCVALKRLRRMSPKISVIYKDRNKLVRVAEWRKVIFSNFICMYVSTDFILASRYHILCFRKLIWADKACTENNRKTPLFSN